MIEKNTQEKNGSPEEEASSPVDDFESLNSDEKAAFDKIMAEIATGTSAFSKADGPEAIGREEAGAPREDSLAGNSPADERPFDSEIAEEGTLCPQNSLPAEAGHGKDLTDGGGSPSEEANSSSEEELSEDQQAALEKIMAQIESRRGADKTASQIEPAPEKPAEAEDAAAELDEAVNEDQQATLDKIMAEIQSRSAGQHAAISGDDSDPAAMPEEQQAALDQIMAEIHGRKAAGRSGGPDTAAGPQAGSDEPLDSEQADLNKIMVEIEGRDNPPNSASSGDSNENLTLDQFSDELNQLLNPAQIPKPPESSKKSEPPADPENPAMGPPAPREPLEKHQKASTPVNALPLVRKRRLAWASAVLVIGLIGCVYLYRDGFNLIDPTRGPSPQQKSLVSAPLTSSLAEPLSSPASVHAANPADGDPLELLIQELQTAQGFIETKIKEIEELKAYYRQGIIDERLQIGAELKENGFMTLEQALRHTKIDLTLRTIQRQMVYSAKLQAPLEELEKAFEELLYLERRTRYYKTLADATSGIAVNDFKSEVASVLEHRLHASNRLSVDAIEVATPSLETIWKEVHGDLKRSSAQADQSSHPLNQAIEEEVCRGMFERKYQLTALTAKSAGCLLQWSGKDLYLNDLRYLSPEAAATLAAWPGEWLSLNGLRDLSPETARELAKWKGKRLSLNGLSRLTTEATSELSGWQGEQIELTGLRSIGRWENYVTRLYLSEELKRRLEVQ